jgi:hypothetical protein
VQADKPWYSANTMASEDDRGHWLNAQAGLVQRQGIDFFLKYRYHNGNK